MKEESTPRLRREMTKNGRGVSAKLTESEYKEWVKLGKGKWLRSLLKDSKFEREKHDTTTQSL
jgi:hypothetical protein